MRCRVCTADRCVHMWANVTSPGTFWYVCPACGSHTHDIDAAEVAADYSTEAYRDHLNFDGHDPSPDALKANVEWFGQFRGEGREFLDVGHLNGAGLEAMKRDGWSVHGFDVNPHGNYGPHTKIHPFFQATLFDKLFDAVLCREVIEHVAGWRMLLMETFKAVKVGGLVQIQTPRPTAEPHPIVHQKHHLQIFSTGALEDWCRWAGFEVADRRLWDIGQALMLRRLR